jgi:hypothetical protein
MAVVQHCRLVDVVSPLKRAAPYPSAHPRAVIEVSPGSADEEVCRRHQDLVTDLAEISARCVGGWAYVIALSGAALKEAGS